MFLNYRTCSTKNMTNSKKYKYILFDWDGTLAKTLDIWLDSEREMLVRYNLEVPDSEIVKSFGDWNFAMKFGLDKESNDVLIKELVELVDEKLGNVELYTNGLEVLNKLKDNGVKLALVTTAKRITIDEQDKRFSIYNVFDCVVTAEDVKKHKPDPEVVFNAMEKIKANPDETLIVGDNVKDNIAGKNAGIDTCLFYPKENEKFYKKEDLLKEKPKLFITNLPELLNMV